MTLPTMFREFMAEWSKLHEDEVEANKNIDITITKTPLDDNNIYIYDKTSHKEGRVPESINLIYKAVSMANNYGISLQIIFACDPSTHKPSTTQGLSTWDAETLGFHLKQHLPDGTFGREKVDASQTLHPVMIRKPMVTPDDRKIICFFEQFDHLAMSEDLALSVTPRNGRILISDQTEFKAGEAPPSMQAAKTIMDLADRFGLRVMTKIADDPDVDDDESFELGMNASHYTDLGFTDMGSGTDGEMVMQRLPAPQPLRYMTSITLTGGVLKSRSGYHPGFITAQVEGEKEARFFGEFVSMKEAAERLGAEGINCDIMSEDDNLRDAAHAAIAKNIAEELKAIRRPAPAP